MNGLKSLSVAAALACAVAMASAAYAASNEEMSDDMPGMSHHEHGMAEHMHGMKVSFGEPGRQQEVTKTIHVQATDQMRFTFDRTDIKLGDVVKFVVVNTGKLKHEFVIGDAAYLKQHAAMMKDMPDMEHNDPNAATLEPGETRTLIWKFDKPVKGEIVFACAIPGHSEAGMVVRTKLQR